MFGKSAEEKVVKDADKITSLVEDLHSVSWDRVTEISKLLSDEHTEEQQSDWLRELTSIAQANISLLGKLDILSNTGTGKTMSSGIELRTDDIYVNQGNTRKPSLETRLNLPKIDIPDPSLASLTTGPIPRVAEQPGNAEKSTAQAKNEQVIASEKEMSTLTQENSTKDKKSKKKRSKKEFFIPTAPSVAPSAETSFMKGDSQGQSGVSKSANGSEIMSSGMPALPREQTQPSSIKTQSPETSSVVTKNQTKLVEKETAEKGPGSDFLLNQENGHNDNVGIKQKVDKGVARFKQLYSSRDGGLFLYEDEFGHLVAVDSSKLA